VHNQALGGLFHFAGIAKNTFNFVIIAGRDIIHAPWRPDLFHGMMNPLVLFCKKSVIISVDRNNFNREKYIS
jgi:hypothetical protein